MENPEKEALTLDNGHPLPPMGPVGFGPAIIPDPKPTDENLRMFAEMGFSDGAKGFSYLDPHMRKPTRDMLWMAMQFVIMSRRSDPDFNRKALDPKWINAPPQAHEPGYQIWRIVMEDLALGPSVGGVARRLWTIIKRNQPAIGYGGGGFDGERKWRPWKR